MMFRKIASNLRLDTGAAGAKNTYDLQPLSGGMMAKVCQFSIKVVKTSDDSNTKIGLDLYHGPDG